MRLEELKGIETPEGVLVARTYSTPRDIRAYGNVVGDYARVHRNKKIAQFYELISPPLIGTHIAAIALQLARISDEKIQQRMKYRLPTYARQWTEWYRKEQAENVTVTIKQNERIRAEFSYRPTEAYQVPDRGLWCTAPIEITENKIRGLLKRTKGTSRIVAQNALGYAVIPAALVTLVQRRCEKPSFFALHRSSEVNHWRNVHEGEAQVRIYEASIRTTKEAQAYTFRGELVQDNHVMLDARMVCVTREAIDLDKLKDVPEHHNH